jgi:hypothetical protein
MLKYPDSHTAPRVFGASSPTLLYCFARHAQPVSDLPPCSYLYIQAANSKVGDKSEGCRSGTIRV